MSVTQKARFLMSHHHQLIRNRSQSMLLRTGATVGLHSDVTGYRSQIQGMTPHSFIENYDRAKTAMS